MNSGDRRRLLGQAGEETAARFLTERGYRILEANYRCPLGEIDLVAEAPAAVGDGVLAFVEVKLRRGSRFGAPQEAVDRRKRLRLARLAEAWLQAHPGMVGREVRFDVIGLTPGAGGGWAVEHLPGAFDPE